MKTTRANGRSRPPWGIVGASHAIVGFALAFLIDLIFVTGIALELGWFLSLEEWGTDFGMKFVTVWESPGSDSAANSRRYGQPNIVFLDIDDRSCVALVGDPIRCRADLSGQSAILVTVGNAIRTSGARLVILDFLATGGAAGSGSAPLPAFEAAYAGGAGPLVIAAAPAASVLGSEAAWLDWQQAPGGGPVVGRLRYAAALVRPTSHANDAVLRRFPLMLPVRTRNDDFRLPSIAFAAALYTTTDISRDAADCILYHEAQGRDIDQCRLPSVSIGRFVLPTTDEEAFERAIDHAGEARVDFLLRPLTPRPGIATDQARDEFRGVWDYYPLSDFIRGRTVAFPSGPFAGAIVIIGSSAAAAGDWHHTPLGYMTGAEVIANEIVAIRTAAFHEERTLAGDIWHAFKSALVAGFLMTFAWFPIAFILRASESPGRLAFAGSIFVIVSMLTLVLMLARSIYMHSAAVEGGQAIDFLIPTIAVMLEGYLEGGKAIVSRVTHTVEMGAAKLWALLAKRNLTP